MLRLLPAFLLVSIPLALPAQSEPAPIPAPGDVVRLRVRAGDRERWHEGRWEIRPGDSLALASGAGVLTFDRTSVVAIERAAGTRGSFWRGALVGALVGGIYGGVTGANSDYGSCTEASYGPCYDIDTKAEAAAMGAIAGVALGGTAGGLVGLLFRRTRWEPVVPVGGGVGVRTSF